MVYMGIIFYLSANPVPETIVRLGLAKYDYLLHAIEYAGLSILLFRALNRGMFTFRYASSAPYAVIISTAYGISDELHQWFVPGRSSELSDVLADLVGSTIGVLLIFAGRWVGKNGLPTDRTFQV